jgi:hypothetical protein
MGGYTMMYSYCTFTFLFPFLLIMFTSGLPAVTRWRGPPVLCARAVVYIPLKGASRRVPARHPHSKKTETETPFLIFYIYVCILISGIYMFFSNFLFPFSPFLSVRPNLLRNQTPVSRYAGWDEAFRPQPQPRNHLASAPKPPAYYAVQISLPLRVAPLRECALLW